MITEQELKDRCTPEFIKWMCEFAEGFKFIQCEDNYFSISVNNQEYGNIITDEIIFPLLIHRAVEGWNKINPCKPIQILCNCISFITDEDDPASVEWGYDNEQYEPCHLTVCEMAIWDCLLNILKQEESDE